MQVSALIGRARSSTELLSDMLINSSTGSGGRPGDSEGDIINDLITEVGSGAGGCCMSG